MASRRTGTGYPFGNGRSSNGEDVNGSSRSGGCSYLSSVKPENRSTLCSVIAQLTEETQPSFETTLKSKAVSENCNVKFYCVVTGHPSPQITWYKDDMQLDRYCGLPKYEIFRNGQSHSLHIYNCTVDDAAIYQASAINTKGIVSCAGILEVGEMNEFKIHQRYFDKLKQKAVNRHKEVEGKENQEPLRTISPDRTQRKRRSTMVAFLSMPSSMEGEGNEENHQAAVTDTEARLQEPTVEKVEEKPVQVTNVAASGITNGQTITDNDSKGETWDSTQKSFTAVEPQTPFVKKKIKISNNTKDVKADSLGERLSKAKHENSLSIAQVCTEEEKAKGYGEELMEVDSDLRNIKKQHKSAKWDTKLAEKHSRDENAIAPVSPQKEQLTASVPRATLSSIVQAVSKTEEKKVVKHEKDIGMEHLEMGKQNVHIVPAQPQPCVAPTSLSSLKKIHAKEHATPMDVDVKPKASHDGPSAERHSESVESRRDSRTALPQRPCDLPADQLSKKETSPPQKKLSVSRTAQPREVMQAHTKKNRNGAPVGLELPSDRRAAGLPQQKTSTETGTVTGDIQTASVKHGLQAAIDKTAQGAWDHSRDSDNSCVTLSTNLQKTPLKSQGGAENNQECNTVLTTQQSRVSLPIKTAEETEMQVEEKVEGEEIGRLFKQANRASPNKKIVDTESETAAQHVTEQSTHKEKNTSVTESVRVGAVTSKETKQKEPPSIVVEKTKSISHNLKSEKCENPCMPQTKTADRISSFELMTDFQEISKPETKVISIAELLRSQIKALESTLVYPVSIPPAQSSLEQGPYVTGSGKSQDLSENGKKCEKELKKIIAVGENDTSIAINPPTNIKATLMEVYRELHKTDQEEIQGQVITSSPVVDPREPLQIPPVSQTKTDTTVDIKGQCRSAEKYNEAPMDVSQYIEITTLDHPNGSSDFVSVSGSENVKCSFPPLTSKEEPSNTLQHISNPSGTVCQESGVLPTVMFMKPCNQVENATKIQPIQGKDIGIIDKLPPKLELNGENETEITETNLTALSDQYKTEEHNTNSLHSVKEKFPPEREASTATHENNLQQETFVVKECLSSNPIPEPSPLLKRRNCVSPIPSATQQELALGARRKIPTTKARPEEPAEATSPVESETQKKEEPMQSCRTPSGSVTLPVSPSPSRRSPLLQPTNPQTSAPERCSPMLSKRKMASENQTPIQLPTEEGHTDVKPEEKDKYNQFKAPQVIRKMRAETFADTSGHLKLWCQFFNILTDSTIKWYRNEEELIQVKRNAGDEAQVNLVIVQASCKDAGVYGCSISNEFGTDSTDILLSADILTGMSLREDLGVGEEIEMTPLIFNKGVADSGTWGSKFFGRVMMKDSHIGDGCAHKVWRAKVIYGLEPVFESGDSCIIKVRNPIDYGGKEESCLIDKNLEIVKQECKIHNLAREYCKIFSAEARVIENFGATLEVIPIYLIYRPANTVPYATVQTDLTGVYQKYSNLDFACRLDMKSGSEVEQKCCTLLHWIYQWTNGNLLFTRVEGVDAKITNIGISVKSTGHLGLPAEGNPKVFEHFVLQHKCNYFCGLLSLRPLKLMDSLMTPAKPKGSKSPLLQRKMVAGSSSPQTGKKAAGSPKVSRKAEQDGSKTPVKEKTVDAPK
ncbi:alpha-protein kinase 3 [Pholidichthys leucotaenia]